MPSLIDRLPGQHLNVLFLVGYVAYACEKKGLQSAMVSNHLEEIAFSMGWRRIFRLGPWWPHYVEGLMYFVSFLTRSCVVLAGSD